jgi:hypothetical protein
MYIRFGKHRGETAESVVLKHPDFITWVLAQKPATEGFAELVQEFCRLIERFDSLPILTRCHEAGCARPATRYTLYCGAITPYWWCATCDPIASGARPRKLIRLRTYSEACHYVAADCNGRRADLAQLIREIARAKGLPDRVREAEAVSFFA